VIENSSESGLELDKITGLSNSKKPLFPALCGDCRAELLACLEASEPFRHTLKKEASRASHPERRPPDTAGRRTRIIEQLTHAEYFAAARLARDRRAA
jgi:hypothetical protein